MATENVWSCKIGPLPVDSLPKGADAPMRKAVEEAFYTLTGQYAEACFSGWGDKFTASERSIVNNSEWPMDHPQTVIDTVAAKYDGRYGYVPDVEFDDYTDFDLFKIVAAGESDNLRHAKIALIHRILEK